MGKSLKPVKTVQSQHSDSLTRSRNAETPENVIAETVRRFFIFFFPDDQIGRRAHYLGAVLMTHACVSCALVLHRCDKTHYGKRP